MQIDLRRTVAALAGGAALLLPSVAYADGPPVKPGPAGHQPPAAKALFQGQVMAINGSNVVVHVDRATPNARVYVGSDVPFDVSSARIVVRDINGDGSGGLDDVVVSDHVVVGARITGQNGQPLPALGLMDRGTRSGPDGKPGALAVAKELCDRSDGGSRLSPDQLAAIHSACQALQAAVTAAWAQIQAAVQPLRDQLQAAQNQLRSACQAALQAGDREACKQAYAQFTATVAPLKQQYQAATADAQSALASALAQFRAAVAAVIGQPDPAGAPKSA